MVTENNDTEHTHIVYSVEKSHELTLTKIGTALADNQGGYVFNVNPQLSAGDILLYRKESLKRE
ncbi:hypothetical protein [Enterobacter kobei]|uniref:hypothetical protein n=1 Tax=Enterobacter kobei TaxID=208224 RepID=UPI00300CED24